MTFSQATEVPLAHPFIEALDLALHQLAAKDRCLLDNDRINERALSFRLAMHLQAHLPSWEIDCEYNGWDVPCHAMKHVVTPTHAAATEARTVFPDIAVHRRETGQRLALIEIVKSGSRFGKHQDTKKLKAYKTQMGYEFALLLTLGVGADAGSHYAEVIV
ncbi:hypothetical protein MHM84_02455 [Halomonas sp. McH1-25]|uniref:hypothetical protein n=1 Tax=unclassified Halomonas TaxID=2609666 RepID=UPI001EF5F8BB|nr:MULTISPECIES: hypothetical protein [unclassified Halomonas]MCG7598639.1 hypothetical protein [Halomonas sp. McH1-25]MCP1343622.1 hypothetical protein [Halomonas sp. FL8]MCP1363309.1 hypothetical protein [Halomonas sp. BBD45]MCP1366128.1 hypothetical protein [Halomonas sp. BBD48]